MFFTGKTGYTRTRAGNFVETQCNYSLAYLLIVGQDGKATIYIDAPTEGHCDTAIAIHIGMIGHVAF